MDRARTPADDRNIDPITGRHDPMLHCSDKRGHRFIHLREEQERDMWGEAASRLRQTRHYDVFFCERCLRIEKRLMKRTDPYGRTKDDQET